MMFHVTDTVAPVSFTAPVFVDEDNERYVVFGVGWITDGTDPNGEYETSLAIPFAEKLTGFMVTEELYVFEEGDPLKFDITLRDAPEIHKLLGLDKAMKV